MKKYKLPELLAEAKRKYDIDIDNIRLRELIYHYRVIPFPEQASRHVGLYPETTLSRLKEVLRLRKIPWTWEKIRAYYEATAKEQKRMKEQDIKILQNTST